MRINVINLKKYRNEYITIVPHTGGFRLSESRTYKIIQNDAESAKILLDSASESDVFGYELLLTEDGLNSNLFHTDTQDGLVPTKQVLLSNDPTDIKKMNLYYLSLQKPSCFPLLMNQDHTIIDELNNLTKILSKEKIIVQIMIQKVSDLWKQKVSHLYENYLTGIDQPSNSKTLLALQQKLNVLTNKIDDWNVTNKEIEALQKKLEEDGFRVVIRLGVYGQNHSSNERIADKILKCFKKTSGSNVWGLLPVTMNKKSFIENFQMRRFPLLHGKYQYLCNSELLPLLTFQEANVCQSTAEPTEEILFKDENKTVRISYKLPSLIHLPKGATMTKEDNSKQVEAINKALERVGLVKEKVKVHVVKVQQGATIKKVTFNLPKGVKYSQVEGAKKDIQNELGLSNVSIEQGEQAGTVALSIPKEKRDKVFLRDNLDTAEFKEYAKEHELPFLVGVGTAGHPIYEDMARVKHLLVAGATGSGKSVWLNQCLTTLLLTKTPSELLLYIIDPKMVEFTHFKDFPHVQDVIIEPDKTLVLLQRLVSEMNERYRQFADFGCKNIQQYNRKSSINMHYIVVIIDEFSDLFMTNDAVESECIKLAQKARACGIHLVLATQRPSVDVVTGLLKAQFPSRIVFACSSSTDYRTVLDQKPSFKLLGKGDGVCQLEGIEGLQRFQGAIIANSEEDELLVIEKIKSEWQDILEGKETSIDLPEPEVPHPEPSNLEKAKYFICEERDTRVRSLQQHLNINSNEMKKVYDDLVDEGWLERPVNSRSGYKILVEENEMGQFMETFGSQYVIHK